MSKTAIKSTLNEQDRTTARQFGRVNWLGLKTLYIKEVRRFMKVYPQTLLAPMVSNLLFMTVFVLGRGVNADDIIPFLAPGLIMLGILGNASANSSSSLMTGKLMGSISDVLMPPLSHTELTLGFIGGAVTRGVVVALATAFALSFVTPLWPAHIWAVLFFGLGAASIMAMVGVLSGIWAEKFDQLAVVNQFVILPLSFLSGTFYSIDALPAHWQPFLHANPLFYMIDGFRYGFTGMHDSNLLIGVSIVLALNLILFIICLRVFKSGWKLKA